MARNQSETMPERAGGHQNFSLWQYLKQKGGSSLVNRSRSRRGNWYLRLGAKRLCQNLLSNLQVVIFQKS